MLEPILEYIAPHRDKISLVVKDLKTGETISHSPDRQFSSASAIKYPIMWAYYEQVAQGRIDPHAVYPLYKKDKAGTTPYDSGVLRDLHEGVELTYEDYVKFMIVVSDDTATNILINLLGMDHINETIRRIGLKNTVLGRMMMDYEALEAGRDNFFSAGDMALLSELILTDRLLSRRYNREMEDILCNQRHNDSIPRFLPQSVRVGHKGGCIVKYGMDHDVGFICQGAEPRLLVNVLTQWVDNARDVIGAVSRMAYELAIGPLPQKKA